MKTCKSGKQRAAEIKAARHVQRQRQQAASLRVWPSSPQVPVDASKLVPNNSYGWPDFVQRGYYLDRVFRCRDCGAESCWTAERQRWWYEIAGGSQYSTAVRCAACRETERLRKQAARLAAGHGGKSAQFHGRPQN